MADDESGARHFQEMPAGGAKIAGSGVRIDERFGLELRRRRESGWLTRHNSTLWISSPEPSSRVSDKSKTSSSAADSCPICFLDSNIRLSPASISLRTPKFGLREPKVRATGKDQRTKGCGSATGMKQRTVPTSRILPDLALAASRPQPLSRGAPVSFLQWLAQP
jgi:hypothetical protein